MFRVELLSRVNPGPERSAWASGTTMRELWARGYAGDRLASSLTSLINLSSERSATTVRTRQGIAGGCFASSSPRSSSSTQFEARGRPSLLCASFGARKWICWRPIRVELFSLNQPQPSSVSVSCFTVGGLWHKSRVRMEWERRLDAVMPLVVM